MKVGASSLIYAEFSNCFHCQKTTVRTDAIWSRAYVEHGLLDIIMLLVLLELDVLSFIFCSISNLLSIIVVNKDNE